MMRRNLAWPLALALLLAGAACSEEPSGVTVAGGGVLEGTWQTACFPSPGGDSSGRVTITFTDTAMAFAFDKWEAITDCSGDPTSSELDSRTYAIGAEASATLNGTPVAVSRATSTTYAYTITPNVEGIALYYRLTAYCGITDWAAGVATDVLNTVCGYSESERTHLTVLYIDTAVTPQVLYPGASAPLDAEGYPTALDSAFALVRQGSGALSMAE